LSKLTRQEVSRGLSAIAELITVRDRKLIGKLYKLNNRNSLIDYYTIYK